MCPACRLGGTGRTCKINELNESEPSFRKYWESGSGLEVSIHTGTQMDSTPVRAFFFAVVTSALFCCLCPSPQTKMWCVALQSADVICDQADGE